MLTTFAYSLVSEETAVHFWAGSPPSAPPKEMTTLPPEDLNELIYEVKAPSESPPSSHSGVQPDFGIRKASV